MLWNASGMAQTGQYLYSLIHLGSSMEYHQHREYPENNDDDYNIIVYTLHEVHKPGI